MTRFADDQSCRFYQLILSIGNNDLCYLSVLSVNSNIFFEEKIFEFTDVCVFNGVKYVEILEMLPHLGVRDNDNFKLQDTNKTLKEEKENKSRSNVFYGSTPVKILLQDF